MNPFGYSLNRKRFTSSVHYFSGGSTAFEKSCHSCEFITGPFFADQKIIIA